MSFIDPHATRRSNPEIARLAYYVLLVFLPVLLVVGGLALELADLGPASKVHDGRGTVGVFRVISGSCGKSCSYRGNFVPDHTLTPLLTDVTLDSDTALASGQDVPMVEAGGRLYRPDENAWAKDVLVITLCLLALPLWAWAVLWRPIRRRRGLVWGCLFGPLATVPGRRGPGTVRPAR